MLTELPHNSGAARPTNGPTSSDAPIIRLQSVEKVYRGSHGHAHALHTVDLSIERGEVFGIIGRSGAGKSTLLRILNLLEQPTSGMVLIDGHNITRLSGKDLRYLRQKIGFVFQQFNLLGSKTVYENVRLPLRVAGAMNVQAQRARVEQVLDLVGLTNHARNYPRELSGGQQQRVGIARALVNHPSVLLCDEPTSALDTETTRSILSLLRDINQRLKLTIVLITHSMDVIRATADRVAVIDYGRIVESGVIVDVFLKPQHPTTRALLAEASFEAEGVATTSWQERGRGRVLRLTYRGTSVATPLLTSLAQELGQQFSILQGSIGRIGATPYGELIIGTQEEDEQQLQRLLNALISRGIDYEVLV
jgi:D-methionine transport system ATP-binding protein